MKIKTVSDNPDSLIFRCPGCHREHLFPIKGKEPLWTFNGDFEKPTITPSLHITGYSYRTKGDFVCHVIITDGKLNYCGDCTHELKGQVVDMLDIVEDLEDYKKEE